MYKQMLLFIVLFGLFQITRKIVSILDGEVLNME